MKTAILCLLASLASGLFNHNVQQNFPKGVVASTTDGPTLVDTPAKRMSDNEFLLFAYNNSTFEIKAAKLARRMTGNSRIRKFAVARLFDQQAANKDITALLTIKGIALPKELPADLKARYEDLDSWMGKEFNDKYLGGTIESEKVTTALFQYISANGKDADIRQFAKNTVGQFEAREDSAINLLKFVDRPATSTW